MSKYFYILKRNLGGWIPAHKYQPEYNYFCIVRIKSGKHKSKEYLASYGISSMAAKRAWFIYNNTDMETYINNFCKPEEIEWKKITPEEVLKLKKR